MELQTVTSTHLFGGTIMSPVPDPYPVYRRLRHERPVIALEGPLGRTTLITRYADVCAALKDGETFSSRGNARGIGLVMGRTILEMEGKEHLRQRRLVTPAFSPRALRDGLEAVVERTVHQLVDQFLRDGQADLVSQFTFTYPLRVMAHVMALPIEDFDIDIVQAISDPYREAADLGVRVGDRFMVQTALVSDAVRVTALVDLGVKELNRRTVIVPLRAAQSFLDLPGGATTIDLAVRDVWAAQALADDLRRQLPYQVESWQESNAQLVSALNAQSVSTALIRGVVMIVVVLGIASVLVVSVVQKRREIGILRAMGATRGQVLRVFLLQGALVGAIGSALGIVLAVGLIWAFTHFVKGSDGLPLFSITLPLATAWQVALIATVCGVLAAIAPARRAAAMDPAQAIRI